MRATITELSGNGRSRLKRFTAVALAALMVAGVDAGVARADGDPASDILLGSTVFLPQDANIPPAQQAQLLALTKDARTAGVPIRVAIISSKFDLGSVPELFGKPQQYAQFLGAELAFVYRARLLVVMPAGLGVYHDKQSAAADQAAVRGITPAPGGAGLASAALTATQKMAAAAGHRLSLPSATASGTGQTATAHHGSGSTTWIVLGAGLAFIALAAAISIRLRPLWSRADSARSDPGRRG
jgi:hypothetical protein